MPDNVPITAGVGTDIATDQLLTGEHVQLLKLVDGAANSSTRIESGGGVEANALRVTIANNSTGLVSVDDNGGSLSVDDNGGSLSIDDGGGTITVDGTVTVTDGGGTITVDGTVAVTDGGGSLTVDGTVTANLAAGTNNIGDVDILTVPAPLNVVGGGTEAAALRVTIANNSTGVLSVDDNGGALTVDGTVTANLAAGTNNIGDVDVLSVPAPLNLTGGGAEASALRVTIANDSTGVLSVDDNGGALTVDGTVTAVGAAAHDDAVSGNPVQISGEARNSERTAVASGDVSRLVTDLVGKLIALPYANPENFVKGATSDITDTTDTQVIAAQGAGVKIYVTHILVTNGDADTGTFVNIKDGSGGTTIYTGYAASGGGGFSVTLPVPIVTTANTGLYAGCATTGATVRVSASGYKGA